MPIRSLFILCCAVLSLRAGHSRAAPEAPESAISRNLKWGGVVAEEKNYTLWGAAPIVGPEGKIHLYIARWPEANVNPAWRKSSEIAHYIADKPEGPFTFSDVALTGSGKEGAWDRWSAHNPEIRFYEGKYVLLYVSNSNYRPPHHPRNQHIGMAVADQPEGPWKRVGQEGQILADSTDPAHWTHGSQVVNPALIKVEDKYLLYFKSKDHRPGKPKHSIYGVAVANKLEGPYTMQEEPLTGGGTIEDGTVFNWQGQVCLLTTDNHGHVTGENGGGVLWVSRNGGISFDPALTQVGYRRIPHYYADYNPARIKKVYGGHPKFERPKILMLDGKPAWLYAPSGWNVTGGPRTVVHGMRIDLQEGDGPLKFKENESP